MTDQLSKWREEFEVHLIAEGYHRELLKRWEIDEDVYFHFHIQQTWKGYLAARSKAQEEIDQLKKQLEDRNNYFKHYLCSRDVKEYQEWTSHIFSILYGKKTETGSHLPDGLLGIQGQAEKRMKEITHLKALLSQAVPWVGNEVVSCDHLGNETMGKLYRQWLKEVGSLNE